MTSTPTTFEAREKATAEALRAHLTAKTLKAALLLLMVSQRLAEVKQ